VEKFKIHEGSSVERALSMIEAEINRIRERLEELETEAVHEYFNQPLMHPACNCQSDYTGTHRNYCPLYGTRVRRGAE
jgi:hydrogenase maturation factor